MPLMRKPSRHVEMGKRSRIRTDPGRDAAPVPTGKHVELSVVIETSAKAKRDQKREGSARFNAIPETGFDALAKLLVHHVEPELKEILK